MSLCAPEGGAVICNWGFMIYKLDYCVNKQFFLFSSFFCNLYEPGPVKFWSILGKNGQNCPKIMNIQFLLLFFYQDSVILDVFGDF